MLSLGARRATCTSRILASSTRQPLLSSRALSRATAKPQKATKTKKAVSDLPTQYPLPNGTAAKALPEWHDGTKSKGRSPKASASKVKKDAKQVVLEGDEGNEDTEKPVTKTSLGSEVQSNLKKYPDCLLLTRVGQFYESYFDPQASEISALLGIKLASKTWNGENVAMCGFPLTNLERNLKALVQEHGRHVAICEEFSTATNIGVKTFERRVTRIITPGTLIDEGFLDSSQNNYLLAIGADQSDGKLGLAWTDVSTGECSTKTIAFEELLDELTRISPREVVLDRKYEGEVNHPITRAIREDDQLKISFIAATQHNTSLPLPIDETDLKPQEDVTISSITPEEAHASSLLLDYLRSTLMEHMPKYYAPTRNTSQNRMQIDTYTMNALEIRERMREGGTKGSLLSVIKRTSTQGGTRLLAKWLAEPSTSIEEINHRHAIVSTFVDHPYFCSDIRAMFRQLEDLERLIQSFTLNRAVISNLSTLNRVIKSTVMIQERIAQELAGLKEEQSTALSKHLSNFRDLSRLSARISEALDDVNSQDDSIDPVDVDSDAAEARADWDFGVELWGIKAEFSPDFARLHAQLKSLHTKSHKLQSSFQQIVPTLTLRTSNPLGPVVHLARAKTQSKIVKNSSEKFVEIPRSATASTMLYQHPIWTDLGQQIFEVRNQLRQLEKDAFSKLREEVLQHSGDIRKNASTLHELDVLTSFATLAAELKFVRPSMREDTSFFVIDGRHPTVELGLLLNGRTFRPNSIHMSESSNIHIITGPNMAGKSTVLRQTALIAILAQIGSFVPADLATIGIVDRLFSRVGAKDDLYHDRSTFMVEMLETAEILQRATPRSLVIMDEVGRGTTVHDGLAIAYATVHHLATVNKCRTLFATHFHEIADLIEENKTMFETVDFFCTDIHEASPNQFSYSYHLRPGINRDSHGLKVASLAGMPRLAMEVAEETLRELRTKNPQ